MIGRRPLRDVVPAPGRAPYGVVPPPSLVVRLDGGRVSPAMVGGKAASLDRLVHLGFRVPAALAVTTEAYRRFVTSSVWLQAFLQGLQGRRLPPPDLADRERDEIAGCFLGVPLPEDLEAALAAAVADLPGDGPFAVRSSATAEDLESASFAGQHLSVLDVEPDDVAVAVRRVWASLWDPAARAYRHRMGVPEDGLAMAVVVQRMVPAERSGVAFTRDPLDPGAVRVEWVEGLGEALVSGQATPAAARLARPSLRLLDGDADPLAREVARLALRVEEEMGTGAQDVEWSEADGRLWVLQARPVTTLRPRTGPGDGFDTATRPGDRYSPTGVAEMLPGVVPPLLWTVNAPMLEEAFRRVLGSLGALPPGLTGPFAVLARFRGQAALDLSLLQEAARRMTGGDGREVERQYLGRVLDPDAPEPRPTLAGRARSLVAASRAARLRRRSLRDARLFRTGAARVAGADLDPSDLRAVELLAARARVRDLAASGVSAEVAVAVAAVGAYEALETALRRWVGDAAPGWAQRLTQDAAGGSVHDEPDPRASRAVYAGPTWEEGSPVTRLRLDDRAGHAATATRQAAGALAELERTLSRTWRWRLTRVMTGQIVDLRIRTLRRQVTSARHLLLDRETTKAALLRLGGVERRLTLALADRLARRGVLDAPEDVELLADWELEAAVAEGVTPPAATLARRLQVLSEWRARPVLPVLVDDHGEAVEGVQPASQGPSGPSERGQQGLTGWGASPGRHRGRARVVRDLAEGGRLQPGDVLVAPATDPSWTPLLLVAGALVVERGGPLSHAAIVARELGIPAVLNAGAATSLVPDGATVSVDGDSGLVEIEEAP